MFVASGCRVPTTRDIMGAMTALPRHRPALRADELRSLLLVPNGPLARVEIVDVTASTNSDVVADLRADPASWPDGSVLVAEHQAGGRGRAGRTWETPAGTSLTCTFVVRPAVPVGVAGLARAAGRARCGQRAARHGGRPGGAEVAQRPARPRRHRGRGLGSGAQDRRHPGRGRAPRRRWPGRRRHRDRDQRDPAAPTSCRCPARRRSRWPVRSTWTARGCSSRWSTRSSRCPAGGATRAGTRSAPGSPTRSRASAARSATRCGSSCPAAPRSRVSRCGSRDDGGLVVRDAAGAEHHVLAGDVRHVRTAG